MHEQISCLIGLDDFEVRAISRVGAKLDLEVELRARAAACPRCGRGSLNIKDRPVLRFRDLPIGGRRTHLFWRKRRYRCAGCERTFTESDPELPTRQRVTRRFRRSLRERVGEGGAHAEGRPHREDHPLPGSPGLQRRCRACPEASPEGATGKTAVAG